jgi:hypothetical protein
MAYISTFIVGLVFLFSGALKVINAKPFIEHVHKYGVIPPRAVLNAALAFIGLELALGAALALCLFPQWLIPGTILLLLVLTGLSLWGAASGKIEDCGCYGGLLLFTPRQSALLNLGYILLLGVSLSSPASEYDAVPWKISAALLVFIAAVVLARRSLQNPLLDLSRLKPGKTWKAGWLKDISQDLRQGDHFLVFMSKDCSYCKEWVPLMNVMGTQKDLPDVMGIMSVTDSEMEEFKSRHLIHFPIARMDKLLFRSMTDAYPTAILLENGVISNKWMGEMPKDYFERIKQFFKAIAPDPVQKNQAFGG